MFIITINNGTIMTRPHSRGHSISATTGSKSVTVWPFAITGKYYNGSILWTLFESFDGETAFHSHAKDHITSMLTTNQPHLGFVTRTEITHLKHSCWDFARIQLLIYERIALHALLMHLLRHTKPRGFGRAPPESFGWTITKKANEMCAYCGCVYLCVQSADHGRSTIWMLVDQQHQRRPKSVRQNTHNARTNGGNTDVDMSRYCTRLTSQRRTVLWAWHLQCVCHAHA